MSARAKKKATALDETAREVKATTGARRSMGKGLAALLTDAERGQLYPLDAADPTKEGLANAALQVLRAHCARMLEAKAIAGERRVPIVGEKFAGVLARMLYQSVTWFDSTTKKAPGQWASVWKSTLEVAYDAGTVEGRQLTLTEEHPGSKSALIIVDLRDRAAFATKDGHVTFESVLARVKGDPKP